MTITQILILSGLTVIFFIGIFPLTTRGMYGRFLASALSYVVILLTLAALIMEKNNTSKENPCPELEKVENVYRIKPK